MLFERRYFADACLLVLILWFCPGPARAEDPPVAETPAQSVEEIAQRARESIVVVLHADRDGQMHGLGTGFVIAPEGLIATNLHVIGEGRPIRVQLAGGRNLEVTAVHAFDRAMDLAVLQVDPGEQLLTALPLAEEKPRDGTSIVVLGNPQGLKHSVVTGVISASRELDGRPMLQLAVPIEPGNSGGPVLDLQGRVHGIVTMKSLVTENLGFAVQVDPLRALLEKPNSVPMARWRTLGAIDSRRWTVLFGATWRQRAGLVVVDDPGEGFGGRSLLVRNEPAPELPYEISVRVKLDSEAGAAGLAFCSDGANRHYGFYPSNGRLRLTRFDGPSVFQWEVLAEESFEHYRPGDWNHLKVRLEEDQILCYLNDQLVIRADDRQFRSGKAGLAKFRDTSAEFHQFRVGKSLPSSVPSEQLQNEIAPLLAALDQSSSPTPEQLQPLVERGAATIDVLRHRADELEREAARLRQLAVDVHVQQIAGEIEELLSGDESAVNLLRAGLLVAQLDQRELEVESYLTTVDEMAEEIRASLGEEAGKHERLEALDKYLFDQNGFHGSRWEYYHRANSYMNRVIDDREGIPLSLAILYIDLARRLDVSVEGVGLPGHFVVQFRPEDGEPQIIDVFNEAKRLTREEAARTAGFATAENLPPDTFAAARPEEIIVRMLRNLLGVAQREGDREAMLRYVEAMLRIQPELVRERGLRAILRFETGRYQAALADLDWFLTHEPEGIDPEQIRQLQEYFHRQQPRRPAVNP